MPDKPVAVAGIVLRDSDGKYLLVQEALTHVRGLWNLPAGHVDMGETPSQAALREAMEETGYKVSLVSPDPIVVDGDTESNVTKYSYQGVIDGGEINFPKDELLDAKWLSLEEITLLNEEGKLRSPWVINSINQVEASV